MPRTLPAHLRSVDMRKRILDVADRLLSRHGYGGLTMDRLSEQVGIAKGTVYLYFTNKEDVAVSVIDRIFHRVLTDLEQMSAGDAAPSDRLCEMLVARVMLRHHALAHYTHTLQPVLDAIRPSLHQYRQKHRLEETRIFARVIDQACRRRVSLADMDPMQAAGAMLWATDALLPSYLSAAELKSLSRIEMEARQVAALLTRGLSVSRSARLNRRRRLTTGARTR